MAFGLSGRSVIMNLNLNFSELAVVSKDLPKGSKQIRLDDLARELRIRGDDITSNDIGGSVPVGAEGKLGSGHFRPNVAVGKKPAKYRIRKTVGHIFQRLTETR